MLVQPKGILAELDGSMTIAGSFNLLVNSLPGFTEITAVTE
jgi:hypothetical protein